MGVLRPLRTPRSVSTYSSKFRGPGSWVAVAVTATAIVGFGCATCLSVYPRRRSAIAAIFFDVLRWRLRHRWRDRDVSVEEVIVVLDHVLMSGFAVSRQLKTVGGVLEVGFPRSARREG